MPNFHPGAGGPGAPGAGPDAGSKGTATGAETVE